MRGLLRARIGGIPVVLIGLVFLVGAYILWRRHQQAAADAATTDTTGLDTGAASTLSPIGGSAFPDSSGALGDGALVQTPPYPDPSNINDTVAPDPGAQAPAARKKAAAKKKAKAAPIKKAAKPQKASARSPVRHAAPPRRQPVATRPVVKPR